MAGRLLDYAGPVLRAARERAGATQREIAERGGASTATVSRLENGIALPADPLIDAILKARRIALYGAGREGLAIKGFAMRLFHLGLDAHVVADMTTPPLGPGDLLIVTSGQGQLPTAEALMDIAMTAGARTALVTAEPAGRAARLADVLAVIPAQTMAGDRGPNVSILPMGSLFEFAETIFFELVIIRLRARLGETADTMRARHTNLE
jgi:6-phospho-3-hexuloisomerase